MNLAPRMAERLTALGIEAIHWITVGKPTASDREIFEWAGQNDHVIVTHDLDFPALLANTMAQKPSTILIRTSDIAGEDLARLIARTARAHTDALTQGAIITLDITRMRLRVLPL